jgi:PAS domain S-box-containing protein
MMANVADDPFCRLAAQRFDLLSEEAAEYALFLMDLEGKVICWNRGAERLFGYRSEEAVGRHFSRFFVEEDVISGHLEYEMKTARDNGHAHSPSKGATRSPS